MPANILRLKHYRKLAALVHLALYADGAAQWFDLCFGEVQANAFTFVASMKDGIQSEDFWAVFCEVNAYAIIFYL